VLSALKPFIEEDYDFAVPEYGAAIDAARKITDTVSK
jgi:hypothetical protein